MTSLPEPRHRTDASATLPTVLYADSGSVLEVLTCDDRAFVIYLADGGEAWTLFDPSQEGIERVTVLPNGETDTWSVADTGSLDQAITAVRFFEQTGEREPTLTWQKVAPSQE